MTKQPTCEQSNPGWGSICSKCKHVFNDHEKYEQVRGPDYPCKKITFKDRMMYGPSLIRYDDGTETCLDFENKNTEKMKAPITKPAHAESITEQPTNIPAITYLIYGDRVAIWINNKQVYYYDDNIGEVLHAIFKEIGGTVDHINLNVHELLNSEHFISKSLEGISLSELNQGILRVKKAKLEQEILQLQLTISSKKAELEEYYK